jgi:methionyl-tRNA formyltransferase
MNDDFKVLLLSYPDNPVGTVFLKTFLYKRISLAGIIVEKKTHKDNWARYKQKLLKDGLSDTFKRILNMFYLKIFGQTIVKLAEKNNIKVYKVDKFNSQNCADLLESIDADLLTISSAPILKEYIFNKGKQGCLNAHPGWLPKYRGLGANACALKNGDSPGISVHFLDSGIDTGKIIIREKIEIQLNDTVSKINDRAIKRGAELMAEVIGQIKDNQLILPDIQEPRGKLCRDLPYPEIRKVNKELKKAVKI